MQNIIVTTPEELRVIVREAVSTLMPAKNELAAQVDTITLNDALELLGQYGFPTSKAKMYKLTSAGDVPCRTYGNKLVFSRKEILQWAENQAKPKHDRTNAVLSLARSARRKTQRYVKNAKV
jgi:hypothetical protein